MTGQAVALQISTILAYCQQLRLPAVGSQFACLAEQAFVILTTNLPFSECTRVSPNARLCKALLDRITDRAHIIETGTESYRF
jgi:hypothetical protein